MRVCLHTLWPFERRPVGGTERFLLDAAKDLRRFGIDAFIGCSNATELLTIEDVEVQGLFPKSRYASLRACWNDPKTYVRKALYGNDKVYDALRRIEEYVDEQLTAVEADIVHFFVFTGALSRTRRPRTLLTINENDREIDNFWRSGSYSEVCRLIQAGTVTPPSECFAPSTFYADKYSKDMERTVEHAPIGSPVSMTNWIRRREVRDPVQIIVPSRLYPRQKGQDLALAAAERLRDDGVNFKLTLTGATQTYDPQVREIQAKISDAGLTKFVQLQNAPSMRGLYFAADIALSPERYCSYGLSVREALSLGLPTVLSDIPPYREIGEKWPHCLFFNLDSMDDLVSQLKRAIDATKENWCREAVRFRLEHDFSSNFKLYAWRYLALVEESAGSDEVI